MAYLILPTTAMYSWGKDLTPYVQGRNPCDKESTSGAGHTTGLMIISHFDQDFGINCFAY